MALGYLDIMRLISTFDIGELNTALKELKDVFAAVDKLREPGNTRADLVLVLRELSEAATALADVVDPGN